MTERAGEDVTDNDRKYLWSVRRWYVGGAPEGMCWEVREMSSYRTEVEPFAAHILAMAEGLEHARFETYDCADDRYDAEDNYSMFVVGLRPMTDEDKTDAQWQAEQKERDERELLAELQKKYADG